ncbi:rhodanese domain-containing protein CG4456-like [Macrobrachium nipponense]|uniref:rhodanese domain-containing protein CG4456-like n=1 Tax=Macrobrachium nipponense TaxID=159736 RepID=UPI0030C7D0B4
MMIIRKTFPRLVFNSRCLMLPLTSQFPQGFSTNISLPPDIDYSELQRKLDSDEITLIDVRLPKERSEEGMIPKSKNIVLEALGPIILFPDEKFAKRFGFKKPALDDPIVVSCLGGVRARTAQLALMGVGYNNVRVYVGSFEDWITKGGPVVYPEPDS